MLYNDDSLEFKAAELTRKDAFRVETQAEKELRRQNLMAEAERLDKEVKLGEKQAEQILKPLLQIQQYLLQLVLPTSQLL
jgi:valyl-tRNA synthetase